MRLPKRATCFACGCSLASVLWHASELALLRCASCRAEWLEGSVTHEQAYRYSHIDDASERYLVARARRFSNYLKRYGLQPGRLLDVGCATGAFMASAAGLGWDVTGIELTNDVAEMAQKRTGLPVVAGDLISDTVFPPASFDVVTLWGVLEHVPDPNALLLACRRLTRSKGLVLIETPNPTGLFRLVSRGLMHATRSRLQQPFRETLGAGHVVWYSPAALRAAARRLSFEVAALKGSRNSTAALMARWSALSMPNRVPFQIATAVVNHAAIPLGHPNQIIASLRVR